LQGIDIPVLFGGAPNLATDAALLDSVRQSMTAGMAGIALNASMFWNDGPTGALEQVVDIVFARQPA